MRTSVMRTDRVVCWDNPTVLKIVAHPIVLRVRNIFCSPVIS
jgi:hypothetical protein